MASKKMIEKELSHIKKQLELLSAERGQKNELFKKKMKEDETSSNLLTMLKFMMDENRKTTMLLKSMSETITQLTDELTTDSYPEEQPLQKIEEVPLSEIDASIIQFIQVKGMACAEDIKNAMSYKGLNAASARLNNLFKRGILQRYQLGHKVYYKYDAGKTTNTLIISPHIR